MPQIEAPSAEGYIELAKLLGWGVSVAAGHEATALKSIECVGANTAGNTMGLTTCTYALAHAVTAINGFEIVNGTVSRAGAVTSITHEFTATTVGDSVFGFACYNDDDDCCFGSCLFNAALDLTTAGDKLTCTMNITVKIGA